MGFPKSFRNTPLVIAAAGITVGASTAWLVAQNIAVQPRDYTISELTRQLEQTRQYQESSTSLKSHLQVQGKEHPKKPVQHMMKLRETWQTPDGQLSFTLGDILPGSGGPRIMLSVTGAIGLPQEPIPQGAQYELTMVRPDYRITIMSVDYETSTAKITIE